MSEPESRPSALAGVLFSIFAIAMMSYFAFAAIQGNYGLFRLIEIEAQEMQSRRELDQLRTERIALENLTRRLSAEYLDLDLLDEQARKILGMARSDEIIIR